MASQQRIALVIGNSLYRHSPLHNPINDAALITTRLRSLGYEIVGGVSRDDKDKAANAGANLKLMEMNLLFAEFMQRIKPGAIALVYYAGHGLQVGDQNCLVPIDENLFEIEEEPSLVKIREKIQTLAAKVESQGTLIVLLDACRNDPLSDEQRLKLLGILQRQNPVEHGQRGPAALTRGGFSSFKIPRSSSNGATFIGFATAPGDFAMDGANGNSAFALALDRHLGVRGLDIAELYGRIALDVQDEVFNTSKSSVQDPWRESNLNRPLYLHPRTALPIVVLGIAGFLAGLAICLSIFENGRLIDPTGRPWIWVLGLAFGIAAAAGTFFWGSGKLRDAFFALVGPGFGFALAFAILKLLPDVASSGVKFSSNPAAGLAHSVFTTVTVIGGFVYLAGTALVWFENPPGWPRNLLQTLNYVVSWLLPFIIMFALYRLQFYVSNTNPLLTVTAMFTVVGGVIYAISVALSCRGQRGNFSKFGPMTGAITVGLLMPAIFAAFSAIAGRHDLTPANAQPLLIGLGAVWHMLLGAQLGYCFTYYVPDHRRLAKLTLVEANRA